VPYAGSVEATLVRLQEQFLESGDYRWPWNDAEGEPVPSIVAGMFEVEERAVSVRFRACRRPRRWHQEPHTCRIGHDGAGSW
jgi:hypothetical protein